MQKIRTDEIPLRFAQGGMWLQCIFHLDSTRLEDMEKVPVATFEVFEHLCQLLFSDIRLEAQNSTDNSIGAGLVGGVEVLGLDRRFEGAHNHPGGIGPQIQSLSI